MNCLVCHFSVSMTTCSNWQLGSKFMTVCSCQLERVQNLLNLHISVCKGWTHVRTVLKDVHAYSNRSPWSDKRTRLGPQTDGWGIQDNVTLERNCLMRGKYGPGLCCSCRFSLQELIVFLLGSFSSGLTAAKSPWVLRRAAGRWVEVRVGGYLHIQRCSHGCKEEGEGTFLKWSLGCWGSPQPEVIYDHLDPPHGE